MDMVTAGEIMIPLDEYPHIPYWFTLRQAIAEIQHTELKIANKKSLPRAVLVFDEEYRLLGMVRRRDILRAIEPSRIIHNLPNQQENLYEADIDPNLLEISYDRLTNAVLAEAEKTVGSIMIPIDNTVKFEDHLIKIIYEMNHHHHSMIPVIKDEAVVGVIRTVEIINEIAKLLKIS